MCSGTAEASTGDRHLADCRRRKTPSRKECPILERMMWTQDLLRCESCMYVESRKGILWVMAYLLLFIIFRFVYFLVLPIHLLATTSSSNCHHSIAIHFKSSPPTSSTGRRSSESAIRVLLADSVELSPRSIFFKYRPFSKNSTVLQSRQGLQLFRSK
jgi:hypothetical protein